MALLVVVKGEPSLKYLTEARLTELRRRLERRSKQQQPWRFYSV